MNNLDESAKNINNKNDLARFIQLLISDLKNNENEWENISLEDYLESMSAWLLDSDGLSLNLGEEMPKQPNWSTIGKILLAAKYYE
jgi:hypothetical protein